MADNDAFLRTIGRCWKKSYEAAHGCGDAWDVANLSVEGACRLLGEKGCPGFTDYIELLLPFFVQDEQAQLFSGNAATALAECRAVASRCAGSGMISALAEIEARVAERILLEAQVTGPLQGDASQVFAKHLLPEIALSLFLDKLDTAPKVQERFLAARNGNVTQAAAAQFDFCDEAKGYLEQVFAPSALKLADRLAPRKPVGRCDTHGVLWTGYTKRATGVVFRREAPEFACSLSTLARRVVQRRAGFMGGLGRPVARRCKRTVSAAFLHRKPARQMPQAKRDEWMKAQKQLRRIEKALVAGSDEATWHRLEREWPELHVTRDSVCAETGLSPLEFRRNLIGLLHAHCAEGLAMGHTPLQLRPQARRAEAVAALLDIDGAVRAT